MLIILFRIVSFHPQKKLNRLNSPFYSTVQEKPDSYLGAVGKSNSAQIIFDRIKKSSHYQLVMENIFLNRIKEKMLRFIIHLVYRSAPSRCKNLQLVYLLLHPSHRNLYFT